MSGSMNALDILIIAGITQGVFFTILLLKNNKNRYANRFLAMLGIIVTCLICIPLMSRTSLFDRLPIFLLYLICSPLAIAPLIYLYTRFLISPAQRLKAKDGIHFIPFMFCFLFLSMKYTTGSGNLSEFLGTHHLFIDSIMWINIVQSISYHVYIYLMLGRYSKNIRESFSSIEKISLRWLKTMVILGIGFGFMMLAVVWLGPLLGFQQLDAGQWIIAAMVVMIFIISYLAVRQPEIFQVPVDTKDLRKKYRTSGLSPQRAMELKKKLSNLMDREKPFLNNLLNINDLAKMLAVPTWYISQVINEGFQQNYFDFINTYRVEEARKHLADPARKHMSILDIAYDVGFNSKSTFNTAFKKHMQTTPSDLRRELSRRSS